METKEFNQKVEPLMNVFIKELQLRFKLENYHSDLCEKKKFTEILDLLFELVKSKNTSFDTPLYLKNYKLYFDNENLYINSFSFQFATLGMINFKLRLRLNNGNEKLSEFEDEEVNRRYVFEYTISESHSEDEREDNYIKLESFGLKDFNLAYMFFHSLGCVIDMFLAEDY